MDADKNRRLVSEYVDEFARGLPRSAKPTRRRWRLSWPLLSVVLVATGASVAVARVAEVGPFAYLNAGEAPESDSRLAPEATISVQEQSESPRWQARAYVDGLNQLCITGGPRDPRDAGPSSPSPAPNVGKICAGSEEIAQAIGDPDRPGASFAHFSDLNGSLEARTGRIDQETGQMIFNPTEKATRALVFGVRAAGAPQPTVRWYSSDGLARAYPMTASTGSLRLTVDRSDRGLSATEQVVLEALPKELNLVLWAAEVEIPDGVTDPLIADPSGFVPHGVDDATIEVLGSDDAEYLREEGARQGWTYDPKIERDPTP
ncbi:MAG: hypothetical protein JHD02_10425 [Thermoleophilaceae bacterium]|nr:hypothetical protein [Thermoleophilaceae bacterium]